MDALPGPNGQFPSARFEGRDERELVERNSSGPDGIEENKSLFWVFTDGIGSEHGVVDEEVWGFDLMEDGASVGSVQYGGSKKLAQREGDEVESGLDHVGVDLRDLRGSRAFFQEKKKVVLIVGRRRERS